MALIDPPVIDAPVDVVILSCLSPIYLMAAPYILMSPIYFTTALHILMMPPIYLMVALNILMSQLYLMAMFSISSGFGKNTTCGSQSQSGQQKDSHGFANFSILKHDHSLDEMSDGIKKASICPCCL